MMVLAKQLWGDVILTSTLFIDRMPTRVVENKAPTKNFCTSFQLGPCHRISLGVYPILICLNTNVASWILGL